MKKIILFFVLALALFMISACTEQEGPKDTEVDTPPEIPEDTETPTEMLSGLRCIDDKIEAVIVNTGDAAVVLAEDIKILANGLIVVDPECDKLTLEAGESTVCSDITGHFNIRAGKTNSIQLNLAGSRIIKYVDCVEEE